MNTNTNKVLKTINKYLEELGEIEITKKPKPKYDLLPLILYVFVLLFLVNKVQTTATAPQRQQSIENENLELVDCVRPSNFYSSRCKQLMKELK